MPIFCLAFFISTKLARNLKHFLTLVWCPSSIFTQRNIATVVLHLSINYFDFCSKIFPTEPNTTTTTKVRNHLLYSKANRKNWINDNSVNKKTVYIYGTLFWCAKKWFFRSFFIREGNCMNFYSKTAIDSPNVILASWSTPKTCCRKSRISTNDHGLRLWVKFNPCGLNYWKVGRKSPIYTSFVDKSLIEVRNSFRAHTRLRVCPSVDQCGLNFEKSTNSDLSF